ncbi:MAG: hypothetical protein IJH67_04415 [Thermoguttaceae bacterium]|nr:hypothetical protein [Thermoguttaceae bacterium]
MDQNALHEFYLQNLERDIITILSQKRNISLREATDVYYHSKLAQQIEQGAYGIEFLSPQYLANDLIENELDKQVSKEEQ